MEYQLFLGKDVKNSIYYAACPELTEDIVQEYTREKATLEIVRRCNIFLKEYLGIPPKIKYEEAQKMVDTRCPVQTQVMEHLYYNQQLDAIVHHPRTERSLIDPDLNLIGDIDCPDCPGGTDD